MYLFLKGYFIDAITIGDHLFWFEYIRVFIFTRSTLFTRMAFHCSIACHDLPTVHGGMGDETIYMVSRNFRYFRESMCFLKLNSE